MKTCSVEGCDNSHEARGFCNKHYLRWKNKGSPLARSINDPNEFVDCGDYWEIKLYDNKGNYIASAKIDPEDVEKCRKHKWHLHSINGYVCSDARSPKILLHRFILDLIDTLMDADHIHGDKLDNRKSKLRECNRAQNMQNSKFYKSNTSGERNVHWSKWEGKWRVNIDAFSERHYCGSYDNYDQACQVARTERKRLHKEFYNERINYDVEV